MIITHVVLLKLLTGATGVPNLDAFAGFTMPGPLAMMKGFTGAAAAVARRGQNPMLASVGKMMTR